MGIKPVAGLNMSSDESNKDQLKEVLLKEIENLDSKLEEIDQEIEETAIRMDQLRNDRSRTEALKEHARALIERSEPEHYMISPGSLTSAVMAQPDADSTTASSDIPELTSSSRGYPSLKIGDRIATAVYDMLKSRESLEPEERPMHYRDLAKALEQRNIHIAGRDPGLNMIAHIHKDTRFCRPKRGHYALREWDPESQQNVGGHKKNRRSSR
tara:strand:- start:85 stop:723 length:639 start_codon:yes stop_codon:yes gene_type:complete